MIKINSKFKILALITFISTLILTLIYIFNRSTLSDTVSIITVILIFAIPTIFIIIYNVAIDIQARQNHILLSDTLGSDISKAFTFGGLGVINYNDDYEIFWASDMFKERNISLLGQDVTKRFPALEPMIKGTSNIIVSEITINECIYKVSVQREIHAILFQDISELKALYNKEKDETPAILTISLDNLEEIEEDSNLSVESINADISNIVRTYFSEHNILLIKPDDDKYIGFLNNKDLEEIKNNKFDLLDEIDKYNKKNNTKINISIGVSQNSDDFIDSFNLSNDALDVAESRGGNQACVNVYNAQLEFYGGTNEESSLTSSSKKMKSFAYSLPVQLKKFKKVYCIPHNNADIDAIGACAGFVCICRSLNIEASIVLDEKQVDHKTIMPLKNLFTKDRIFNYCLSEAQVLEEFNNEESVCVVLDCNIAKNSTASNLLKEASNIIIIDHHRKSVDSIDFPIASFFDTTASSTSELIINIAYIMPYKIRFNDEVSTSLLAGIILDTNRFKEKTSINTFKACTYLKERGADESKANTFFIEEYEEFVLKNRIVSNLENLEYGIYCALAPKDEFVDTTLLAICADEILNINDVDCSFAIGYIDKNTVGISARSNGSINVQLIMEKLGGGGHYSASAVQIKDIMIEEAYHRLKDVVSTYVNEN